MIYHYTYNNTITITISIGLSYHHYNDGKCNEYHYQHETQYECD